MAAALKKVLYFLIFYSGIFYFFNLLFMKKFDRSGLILYAHRILEESEPYFYFLKGLDYMTTVEFKKKILYIKRHYKFITLSDYVKKKKAGEDLNRCIVLTFDDGYRSIYANVFPFLKEHKIPFTVFITTGLMSGVPTYWYDRLLSAVMKTQKNSISCPKLGNAVLRLDSLKKKRDSSQRIAVMLKSMPDSQKESVLSEIIEYLGAEADLSSETDLYLTWDQILEMRNSGLVTIGSHTLTHPLLTKINLERAVNEIEESGKIIEQKLGVKTEFFSYPNGNYNSTIQSIVKDSGYSAAFTVNIDSGMDDNIFSIPRLGFDREKFFVFALELAGFPGIIRKITESFKNPQCWLAG